MASYIKRRYFGTRNPGSYSGLYGFVKNTEFKDKSLVKKTLGELQTFNFHTPGRVRFQRNPVFCPTVDYMWSSDILILDKYYRQNKGFRYIVVFVDCLSRMLFTAPTKRKDAVGVKEALQSVIKKSKRKPQLLWTDKDAAYRSKIFTDLLKANNIKLYHVKTPLKASLSERYVRRVKTVLARLFTKNNNHVWVNDLEAVTKNINESYNRSIGMPPSKVNRKNESVAWFICMTDM